MLGIRIFALRCIDVCDFVRKHRWRVNFFSQYRRCAVSYFHCRSRMSELTNFFRSLGYPSSSRRIELAVLRFNFFSLRLPCSVEKFASLPELFNYRTSSVRRIFDRPVFNLRRSARRRLKLSDRAVCSSPLRVIVVFVRS